MDRPAAGDAAICPPVAAAVPLEKDRKRRLADLADAKLELEDAKNADAAGVLDDSTHLIISSRRSCLWIAATRAVIVASTAALVVCTPWRNVAAPVPLRLSAELGANVSLVNQGSAIILSPDGELLAFDAPDSAGSPPQLYVRRLRDLQATALPRTAGARNPFFSPDGQWIGFFADGKLKKVSVTGGAAVTLCDAPEDRGGA